MTAPARWKLNNLADIPLADQEFSDVEVAPDARIVGFFGGKGSGKSLMAAIIAEGTRVRENRRVFFWPASYKFHAGQPIELETLYTMDSNDTHEYDNTIFLIDEFQRFFSKYASSTYRNQTTASFLQQVRKRGIYLFYTTNEPTALDESAPNQTDLHFWCLKHLIDKRCKLFRYHLKDCHDSVVYRLVDTTGKFGPSFQHWDKKRRGTFIMRRVIRFYRLYNTYASVSALEIAQMTKDKVMGAYENRNASMTQEQLENMLLDRIIPHCVKGLGWKTIYPKQFAEYLETLEEEIPGPDGETITQNMGIKVSAKMLGGALRNIGLRTKRSSAGMQFELPSEDELESWQSGGS